MLGEKEGFVAGMFLNYFEYIFEHILLSHTHKHIFSCASEYIRPSLITHSHPKPVFFLP